MLLSSVANYLAAIMILPLDIKWLFYIIMSILMLGYRDSAILFGGHYASSGTPYPIFVKIFTSTRLPTIIGFVKQMLDGKMSMIQAYIAYIL